MKKYANIFITPVQNKSVQGRSEYVVVKPDGTTLPAERSFSKGVGKRYMFPRRGEGKNVVCELSRLVDNPWYNKTSENVNEGLPNHYKMGGNWINKLKDISELKKISKQQELEIRFDLEDNNLTSSCNLDYRFTMRKEGDRPNELESYTIILYDNPNRFDNTTLRGSLAMELTRVNGKIAKNKKNVNPSRHHFYISSENEEVMERNAKQNVINNAITDLTLLSRNQSLFMRYQIGILTSVIKGKVSESTLTEALNNLIVVKSNRQMNNIEKFNEFIDIVNTGAEGVEKLYLMYLIKQATDTNIIGTSGGSFTWYSKKGQDHVYDLGTSYSKLLKFFVDEELKYNRESPEGNWYHELIQELKTKGVQIDELLN